MPKDNKRWEKVTYDLTVKHTTPKALLVETGRFKKNEAGDEEVVTAWLPRSLVKVEWLDEEAGSAEITMPEWLALEREIA